jgi:hypothetical protein
MNMKTIWIILAIINAISTGVQFGLGNYGWAAFSAFFTVYAFIGAVRRS